MPVFIVSTNVEASKVPANFKFLATEVIAKTLSKPKSYVAVHVNAGQNISFGGTDEPAALCDLNSIGALSVEANKKHSKAIMAFLETTLKTPPSRTYIKFYDMNKADTGFNGTTFDALM